MAYLFTKDSAQYMYVHIPKTGGTTIEHGLQRAGINIDYIAGHVNLKNITTVVGESNLPKYNIFTTVRNPWDWYVSWYHFLLYHHKGDSDFTSEYEILDNGFDFFVRFIYDNVDKLVFYNNGMNTKKYAQFLEWAPGLPKTNYIKIEDFSDPNVLHEMGLNVSIHGIHTNKSNHNDYTTYYNEDTKKLVAKLHKDDIKAFKYQF